jgi:hypothetical protein
MLQIVFLVSLVVCFVLFCNYEIHRTGDALDRVLDVFGSLFCFVLLCFVSMRSTELGCFRLCSWCLWKALDEERCIGLDSMTCLDLQCKSS